MSKVLMAELDCDKCAVEKGAVIERHEFTIEHETFKESWLVRVKDVDLQKTHVWHYSSDCPRDVFDWCRVFFNTRCRAGEIAEQFMYQGEPDTIIIEKIREAKE